MKLDDFNNLDPQNVGNWPIPVKAVIIIILCILALGAGYYFDTQHQLAQLETVKGKESSLKDEFKTKQWKAAALPKLKEQLAQIESTLSELLKKLPNSDQVDELIRDISQTVLASGLKSELFEPQYRKQTREKGLYEKLPIKLRISGDYHSFGKFVSGVAALNRIVTQHNIVITPMRGGSKQKTNKHLLTMEMTAQVYRYLEAEPEEEEENAKKGSKGKGKGKK